MFNLFKKQPREKPPYLERIDELEKVDIVRIKGSLDHDMIPIIEARIQENRKMGSKIDKNIILDFTHAKHIDSATIAFHLYHLKEYKEKGYRFGFLNITEEMKALLEIFKEKEEFNVFTSEADAINDLNR